MQSWGDKHNSFALTHITELEECLEICKLSYILDIITAFFKLIAIFFCKKKKKQITDLFVFPFSYHSITFLVVKTISPSLSHMLDLTSFYHLGCYQLVQVFPETKPETRNQLQVLYLGDDYILGGWGQELGKERTKTRGVFQKVNPWVMSSDLLAILRANVGYLPQSYAIPGVW